MSSENSRESSEDSSESSINTPSLDASSPSGELHEENAGAEPITSPVRPYESPLPSPSEPPSSDRPEQSSPFRPSPPSSPSPQSSFSGSDGGSPLKKRKRYEFSRPKVPYDSLYWPSELPSSGGFDKDGDQSDHNTAASKEEPTLPDQLEEAQRTTEDTDNVLLTSFDLEHSQQPEVLHNPLNCPPLLPPAHGYGGGIDNTITSHEEQKLPYQLTEAKIGTLDRNDISSASVDLVHNEAELASIGENMVDQCFNTSLLEATDADIALLSMLASDVDPHIPASTSTGEDNSVLTTVSDSSSSSTASSSDDENVGSSDIDSSSDSCGSDDSGESSSSNEESEASFNIGDLKVYEGCDLSVDEGVYHIMDLFMKLRLTKTAMEYFLKTILKFIPDCNNMPQSRHCLFKYVENICPPVPPIIHYYCTTCLFYVGKEDKQLCPLCKDSCKKFYQLPIASQIRNLFENLNLADRIDSYAEERRSRQCDGKYFDLCDSTEYKRVQLPGKYNLTLLGHTDGIKIPKSSNVSLWPLEFVISEVEPKLRFKFVLIAGVWVDSSKPNMHCYLNPFAEEFQELFHTGIKWINPKSKKEEKSLVVVPFFCRDAPVRADLQDILSCGGKHSCNCCEQKMVKLPPEPVLPGVQRKNRKRVFFPKEIPSRLRTAERIEAQGKKCREIELKTGKLLPQKGVKGCSILLKFPSCDPSTAVYPEYMHGIYGIVKQFMGLWFQSDLECNLKRHRDEIDAMLECTRTPDHITRSPRTTQNYAEWKANECRSFLLYLSVIVLARFMSKEYLEHWMLFVSSVFLLLRDVVSENDIQKAAVMIRIFLRDFPKLYAAESLTYNFHNLSHYGLSVSGVGPLWSNSAFHFEDFNGLLKKRIHGTKNQGVELVKTVQLIQGVQFLRSRFENKSASAGEDQRRRIFLNEIRKCPMSHLTVDQKNLLSEFNLEPQKMFYRADISGHIFTCNSYESQRERNNYTVCHVDRFGVRRYGEISAFVECTDGEKVVFIDCFEIEHVKMFFHEQSHVILEHIIPIRESKVVELIPLDNVLFKVFRVDSFVCIRPNKYEVNL